MGVPGNANALLLRSAAAAGGYQVSRSLRFDGGAYLSRTYSTSPSSNTKITISMWVKRAKLDSSNTWYTLFWGYNGSSSYESMIIFKNDTLYIRHGGSTQVELQTTAVYRDTSAWYHIVLAIDTTQATSTNRTKLYVNGSQVTTFSTANYPAQNSTLQYLYPNANNGIGAANQYGGYFDGYIAECHVIDGLQLDPSSFAETDATTGQWIPKLYSGSYGTNGFKLNFSDNSAATAAALGKDTANSNNWTPNNFSVTAGAGNDSLTDTPTSYGTDTGAGGEVRGNYCTWNPLYGNGTLSNGNLDVSTTTTNATTGTIFASSGKWYWETTVTTSNYNRIGVVNLAGAGQNLGGTANSWAILHDGQVYTNSSTAAYGPSYGVNDVISIALDIDAGKIWYGKNGTWMGSGSPSTGANPSQTFTAGQTMAPAVASGSGTCAYVLNAGARSFAYTAPSGFKALCDTNLTAPVIAKPSTVMDVLLWTGNGSNPRSLTGLNFNPDLVWSKDRNGTAFHRVADSVRGTGNKQLYTNSTDAENAYPDRGYISSFDSGGFTVNPAGSTAGGFDAYNTNATTYVGWCWDAGTSTVTNTQGSITSSVRANASAGFSIVTYTGNGSNATVGHGLGVAPKLIIAKTRSSAVNWIVYHGSLGTYDFLRLNTTDAKDNNSVVWNTAPTSTVFGVGTANGVNQNGDNYVAYCFAPVAGYSSFGSYVGNGSSDGPFVFCGFRPRWVLYKESSVAGSSWEIIDAARNPYNASNARLFPDSSGAENTAQNALDLLSNGFKPRATYGGNNASGATYIWAAFAESPFQYARAR